MKLIRKKEDEQEEELEVPKPTNQVKKQEEETEKEKHTPGQMEGIIDVVGLRVWKNDKEYIDFPIEQRWAAELASVVFKAAAEAEE